MSGELGSGADDLERFADFFDQAAAEVPEEIHGDFATIADAYGTIVRGIAQRGIDPDDPAGVDADAAAELAELAGRFDTEEVQAASDRVNRYLSQHCEG